MKLKGIFAALLLVVAGVQTAAAQGFRVYKSDGTIMQFSLDTDSIVFYDGIGTDVDFGPFTLQRHVLPCGLPRPLFAVEHEQQPRPAPCPIVLSL